MKETASVIPQLDIATNRAARKYSAREILLRILWMIGGLCFRLSPPPCFGFRRWILRCFGAKVGAHVHLSPSTRIYFPWNFAVGDWSAFGENVLIYNLGLVAVGDRVTISHGAHICAGTHDYQRIDFPLQKQPIEIKDQVWICAEAFIGPGVVIGSGAVIGARSVVTRKISPWTVVAGNPARPIGRRELQAGVDP